MKKKLIPFILITLISLTATSCGSYSHEEPPKKNEVKETAEFFKVDEELIVNLFAACKSIGISDPEDTLNFYGPEPSDGTIFYFEFLYEGYVFTAIADADYNITDITSGSMVYMQDGTVVSDLSHLATSDQRVVLQNRAEDAVKDNLISPATAEFPGHVLKSYEWNIYRDGNTFTVSSWVDAQNEYGALLRYDFTVTYDWDGTDDTEPVLIDVVISQ